MSYNVKEFRGEAHRPAYDFYPGIKIAAGKRPFSIWRRHCPPPLQKGMFPQRSAQTPPKAAAFSAVRYPCW